VVVIASVPPLTSATVALASSMVRELAATELLMVTVYVPATAMVASLDDVGELPVLQSLPFVQLPLTALFQLSGVVGGGGDGWGNVSNALIATFEAAFAELAVSSGKPVTAGGGRMVMASMKPALVLKGPDFPEAFIKVVMTFAILPLRLHPRSAG
jgi:hypothetical protein